MATEMEEIQEKKVVFTVGRLWAIIWSLVSFLVVAVWLTAAYAQKIDMHDVEIKEIKVDVVGLKEDIKSVPTDIKYIKEMLVEQGETLKYIMRKP